MGYKGHFGCGERTLPIGLREFREHIESNGFKKKQQVHHSTGRPGDAASVHMYFPWLCEMRRTPNERSLVNECKSTPCDAYPVERFQLT